MILNTKVKIAKDGEESDIVDLNVASAKAYCQNWEKRGLYDSLCPHPQIALAVPRSLIIVDKR